LYFVIKNPVCKFSGVYISDIIKKINREELKKRKKKKRVQDKSKRVKLK